MNDPMMISGFILAHIGMVIIIAGYILPSWYDSLIPPQRRGEGTEPTVPMELKATEGTPMENGLRASLNNDAENALSERSSDEAPKQPMIKDEKP